MGVAAPQTQMGGLGPRPPQKFGHRPYFAKQQLLSRKQVSQNNQMLLIQLFIEQ